MKKTVSIISALIMLVSSLLFGISATAKDETSGYVGNSNKITFNYNSENKTLTLSGKGKLSAQDVKRMDLIDLGEFGPFYEVYSWYDEVEKVVIKEGIQDLPSMTFRGFENLKSAYIPKSVTEIGIAFSQSPLLSDVYYSGTITQWNKINFEYQQRNEIVVEYREPIYGNSNMYIFPKLHIMGSKTGWITENKKTYYLTEENIVFYGKEKVEGKYYIFKFKTGELLKGKVSCGGVKYITDKKDGHLLYGKVRCDNKFYIMSKTEGRMIYGRAKCNGIKYIVSPKTGEIQYGKVSFDGKVYIASKKDGHLFLNAKVKCDGKTYYTDSNGAIK